MIGDNLLQGLKKSFLKNTFWLSYSVEAGQERHCQDFSKNLQNKSYESLSQGEINAKARAQELLNRTHLQDDHP
jgi:hypothetical protein